MVKPNPATVVQQILNCGVTIIRGSPVFYEAIAEYCAAHKITLETVRALFVGGAPVRPELVRSLTRLIPSGEVYVVYGSSEAEPVGGISAQEILQETAPLTAEGKGNCVGRPMGALDVRVIKCYDGPIDLRAAGLASMLQSRGKVGEIVASGKRVNKTYYRNPQAVAETKFEDEHGRIWHRTGDSGYFDDHGRIWLVGRVSSRIVRADQELHPLQVEPIIDALDFVERCGLIGIPDAELGQKAVIVVAAKTKGFFSRIVRGREWKQRVQERCRLRGLVIDEICFKRTIPSDYRHRWKIDYDRLRTWYHRPWLVRLVT
jgi:acyl-CoA synthetase (AMP-forming)/AMP-acid ligase II